MNDDHEKIEVELNKDASLVSCLGAIIVIPIIASRMLVDKTFSILKKIYNIRL
jgi:hypothetical protein